MKIKKSSKSAKLLSILAVALVVGLFTCLTIYRLGVELNFSVLKPYFPKIILGFQMTIVISFFSLIISLIVGVLAYRMRKSHYLFLSYFARFYIELIRGTPLLVQIFFFYYIVGSAWGLENRYVAGVIILSIFEGAYISEIIRGGFASIGHQQYEISTAIGLKKSQTMKLVIFPQLLTRILPSLAGQFASIIKDSSLLSVVAIIELTQVTQEVSAINYALFENYLFLGFLYFCLTFPVILLSKFLEKRHAYAH